MSPTKAAVLDLLTRRARICAWGHIAWMMAFHGVRNREVCRRATRELVSGGLLGRKVILAREPPDIQAPIVTCSPGDAPFDFEAVAWLLERRGIAAPLVPTEVFYATKRCVNLVGGYTKGRDRTFHFGLLDKRVVGMISHLGAMLPVADGLALAAQLSGTDRVAASGHSLRAEGSGVRARSGLIPRHELLERAGHG